MATEIAFPRPQENDLPSGWRLGRVSDVAILNPEQTSVANHFERIEYVDISCVSQGQIGKPLNIPLSEAPSRARRLVREGDTILSTVRPGNRAYAFIRSPPRNLVCSTGFVVLRARRGLADPMFIYFLASSKQVIQHLTVIAEKQTAYPSVTAKDVGESPVLIPPVHEQRAIVGVLGSFDDKIELNRRMNQTLEEICRALFKFWFVDFGPVRAKAEGRWKKGESLPGMPADMWDLWPSEFEESEIGEIPKGWGVDGLGKVASCRRDLIDPSEIDPEEKYVGLEHITPRSLSLWHWGRVGDTVSGKARFKRGEILFGKLRPYFHKVCVPWFDGVASTDILTIAPKSSDWFGFALGHFSSAALVDYATAASNGTKMPRTSWEDLARWQVAMPPVELARTLTTVFLPLVSKMGKAIEESTLLGETRDTLLPKLLSGEIRVKVDS